MDWRRRCRRVELPAFVIARLGGFGRDLRKEVNWLDFLIPG